jgi:hypothetical protein
MPSPSGSIANLSVTRKTLDEANGKKLNTRAFEPPSGADWRALRENAATTGIVRER